MARISFNKQEKQSGINQTHSPNEQELKDYGVIVEEILRTLDEEQQLRKRAAKELSQARSDYVDLENTLGNELANLRAQLKEERRSHFSTKRQLQSALSAAEQARDWVIQREEIVVSGTILGRGSYGWVREGTFRGCKVAVKEMHELILSDQTRKLFEREMSIASCCRHPNLLQFIGATNDEDSPLFVTELLDSSLRDVLSQRALKHEETVILALDIAKGLNYLHLNKPSPIIHRDVKSENVLLWRRDESWRAKLSDYGSANFMRMFMTANQGTPVYQAPEAIEDKQSPKVS